MSSHSKDWTLDEEVQEEDYFFGKKKTETKRKKKEREEDRKKEKEERKKKRPTSKSSMIEQAFVSSSWKLLDGNNLRFISLSSFSFSFCLFISSSFSSFLLPLSALLIGSKRQKKKKRKWKDQEDSLSLIKNTFPSFFFLIFIFLPSKKFPFFSLFL